MSASFTTLFERSRFFNGGRRPGEDDESRSRRMQQAERFAVGMIGFALSIDREFKHHFLARICRLKASRDLDEWQIKVEPHHSSDLWLMHKKSRELVIVEFKIGAPLADHQNPSRRDFWLPKRNNSTAGYGSCIKSFVETNGSRKAIYVTLESTTSWSKPCSSVEGMFCIAKSWDVLWRVGGSIIEQHVYDCLAQFGVQAFMHRKLRQDMENKHFAKHATLPLTLLGQVVREFDKSFDFRGSLKRLIDADVGYFGFKIGQHEFKRIQNLVRPKVGESGWFGYETGDDNAGLRSVWVYCNKAGNRRVVGIQNTIKKKLRVANIKDEAIPHEDGSIQVSCKVESTSGDMEWFVTILKALNN